jgi:hypothetical protein
MSVITTDIVIEKKSREEVLAWLGVPENHEKMLTGAFDTVKPTGQPAGQPGSFDLTLSTPLKKRTLQYRFLRVDEEHGGRRVHVAIEGRRVGGTLHYSLRTMKPTTNTLVTLHIDYDTQGLIGTILDHAGLRRVYEAAWKKVLENLKSAI